MYAHVEHTCKRSNINPLVTQGQQQASAKNEQFSSQEKMPVDQEGIYK
jgi:hypothetical protein